MRNIAALLAVTAVLGTAACQRTAEGDLEVERPAGIETTTDTIRTPDLPDVEVGRDTLMVPVPDIDIRRDTTRRDTVPGTP